MFKQSVGLAPHAFLVQCRIEKACELLVTTDLSVTEIAQAVGYSSSQALNPVSLEMRQDKSFYDPGYDACCRFVMRMGVTPTAYRRERNC